MGFRSLLGVLLAVCFLVSLVASAPARLLAMVLPEEQVYMQGYKGTLWRGSAARCMLRTGEGVLHLGAVEWRLRPLSLLLFAPRLELASSWGSQRIATEVRLLGAGDLDLYQLEANIAADLLRQFVPVGLVGRLSAQLESLSIRDGLPVTGVGRLMWEKGGWVSPGGPKPLGTYALDLLAGQEDRLLGDIVTVTGRVEASGTAQLQGRDYSVNILVGGQRLDRELRQALSLVAQPEAEGYRIKLDGQL